MHFFKHTPLALGIACAMMTTALQAKEWSTLSARATTADGYEVRANLFRVANVPLDYFDGVRAGASKLVLPLPDGGGGDFFASGVCSFTC